MLIAYLSMYETTTYWIWRHIFGGYYRTGPSFLVVNKSQIRSLWGGGLVTTLLLARIEAVPGSFFCEHNIL